MIFRRISTRLLGTLMPSSHNTMGADPNARNISKALLTDMVGMPYTFGKVLALMCLQEAASI